MTTSLGGTLRVTVRRDIQSVGDSLSSHADTGDKSAVLPDFDWVHGAESNAFIQGSYIVASHEIMAFHNLKPVIEDMDSIIHSYLLLRYLVLSPHKFPIVDTGRHAQ